MNWKIIPPHPRLFKDRESNTFSDQLHTRIIPKGDFLFIVNLAKQRQFTALVLA